ncbi:MAG: MBL fold metallo-hydrolase, partial [Bacilli bacterium]
PTLCVGGYHLFNPMSRKTVSTKLLDEFIRELKKFPQIKFYTCHCTGKKAYNYLSNALPNVSYLSCGEEIES